MTPWCKCSMCGSTEVGNHSLGSEDPRETLKLNSEKNMILTFQDNFEGVDENGQKWKDVCFRGLGVVVVTRVSGISGVR